MVDGSPGLSRWTAQVALRTDWNIVSVQPAQIPRHYRDTNFKLRLVDFSNTWEESASQTEPGVLPYSTSGCYKHTNDLFSLEAPNTLVQGTRGWEG